MKAVIHKYTNNLFLPGALLEMSSKKIYKSRFELSPFPLMKED